MVNFPYLTIDLKNIAHQPYDYYCTRLIMEIGDFRAFPQLSLSAQQNLVDEGVRKMSKYL